MGKVSKAAVAVDVKKDAKTKVKKLATSGVTKPSAKANLKDARAPISKLLKNKPDAAKNVLKENDVKTATKTKAKKVANSGVTKPIAKVNLKDARAPIPKLLENKPDVVKSVLKETVKSLKTKKAIAKPTEINIKPKTEQVQIMKTLKRKSNSENSVKLPIPKKTTGSATNVPNKKLKTKKVATEPEAPKTVEDGPRDEDAKPNPQTKAASIDSDQVAKGVAAVLRLAAIQAESKKTLFDGEHQPIFLQVSCIKVPKVPRRQLRMSLPHSLVTDTDDVALFVSDLKKGRAQDFEPTINHYKDLLEQHGCTQIKEVIPLTQVKVEFDQYELKRKLLSSYDFFLTDGKIAGHLSHLLGKPFITKRKLPASVRMDGKDLKLEINKSLRKTSMQLHSNGNSHIVQVAHTKMGEEEIVKNVLHICRTLAQAYPGGWINIRSLMLKTASSLPVPIYMTLKSKNKVKVPVIVPKRPKAHRDVAGELSTAPGNTRVIVKADGTVVVRQSKEKKENKSKESAVEKAKRVTGKLASTKTKQKKTKTKATKVEEEELDTTTESDATPSAPLKRDTEVSQSKTKQKRFDDSDAEIEEAEQEYLSQWQEESTSPTPPPTTIKDKQPKKKAKIVKKRKTKA